MTDYKRVLLIEDDPVDQMAFERYVTQQNWPFDYKIAGSIAKARELLVSEEFDIIVSDYKLPDGEGMDILEMNLATPVIITTGTGSEDIAIKTMRAGACDYLIKDSQRMYLLLLPTTIELVLQRKKSEQLIAMLSEAVKSISDGVCILNLENKIIFVNQALCQMFGFREDELLQNQGNLLNIELEQNQESLSCQSSKEIVEKRKNGTSFFAILSTSQVRSGQSQVIAYVVTFKDITEWKQAEEKALHRAQELARAESELEQLNLFSFVSTHDLQEPLHKILTFSNLIKVDPAVYINEVGQNHLEKIASAVEEMRQLIIQLNNYSKIVTEGKVFKEVDLREVVDEILENLREEVHLLQAKIEVEKLPIVKADRAQMYTMFYNLIKNALIFREKSRRPHIIIKSKVCEYKYNEIMVEDQGIGFDEKHLPRLFKPFQRLHSSSEYLGRGLGLAICQRILLRHRGSITAKSSVGKGSKFIITLPLS